MDEQAIEQTARELLERKMSGVRPLIATHHALADAERAVEEARAAHARAWQQTIASGWSEKELVQDLKISKPDATRGQSGTRRSQRRKTTSTTPAPAEPTAAE